MGSEKCSYSNPQSNLISSIFTAMGCTAFLIILSSSFAFPEYCESQALNWNMLLANKGHGLSAKIHGSKTILSFVDFVSLLPT